MRSAEGGQFSVSVDISRHRVKEVLDLVGISSVGRRQVGKLSLGMKQRLGIACSLLGDPQFLVFDEPLNGLDPEGIIWVRNLLRSLADEGKGSCCPATNSTRSGRRLTGSC
ncbi:MAG: ATP-binding cassette domain-containing protein [Nigerium sp.]|nr:ATP-binding cassette domain-containing protein [Nigerium sp.]